MAVLRSFQVDTPRIRRGTEDIKSSSSFLLLLVGGSENPLKKSLTWSTLGEGYEINPLNFCIMVRFSTNSKYNSTCVEILAQLTEMYDTEQESRNEIARYRREFPKEPDYNLAQYGNLLIYYYQVREMFRKCGYSEKTLKRVSDSRLWEMYLYRVGEVVRKAF